MVILFEKRTSRFAFFALYVTLIQTLILTQLTLTTPALLFSSISLIMLAYTNRFLAYAAVIRNLKDKYLQSHDERILRQIENLKLRVGLTRYMQIAGISSLLLCVLSMFLIYIDNIISAAYIFEFGLLLLIVSLFFLIWEIQIFAKAFNNHLSDIEEDLKSK